MSSSPVMRRVFLSLGSNLGDRMAYLRGAVKALPDVYRYSSVYETEPIGGPLSQGPYLNMVVELMTALSAREILRQALDLEVQAGRVRTVKNGPRTLDVDILLCGDELWDDGDLAIPHPRMWQRRFVLAPLAELAPELVSSDALSTAEGEVVRVGNL